MRIKEGIFAALLSCAILASLSGQEMRKAVSKPTPRYPEIAKQMKWKSSSPRMVKSKNTNVVGGQAILVDATLEALKGWKYAPAKTETALTVTFDFHP